MLKNKRSICTYLYAQNSFMGLPRTMAAKVEALDGAGISLVEGGEGLYLPNCQTNLVYCPLYTVSIVL